MADGCDRREPAAEEPAAVVAQQQDPRPASEPRDGGAGETARRAGASFLRKAAYAGLALLLCGVLGAGGVVAYYAAGLPPIDQLTVPRRPPNIAILARDGSFLANRGATGGREVSLDQLPAYLPKAFVAIEDRRFYDHWGIDLMGLVRAAYRNLTRDGGLQGGSTLTQQLAKNLFLTPERTASRKIQEAILALWLEHTYSKDRILELYLNRVYFGAGAYGVEAAAQRYYGKPASAVSLSEAATLAGLVQAPSRLAPNRNPDAARARAELVLAAMGELGFIAPDAARTAFEASPEPVRPHAAGSVHYAADYVTQELDDVVGGVDSDVVVSTTLEPSLQAAAERALVDALNAKGQKLNVSQGAVVVLRPDGAVAALVGGRDYEASQFNRATSARRQPGSSFKPFVYLTALERGLTPNTVRSDSPVNINGWRPENYDRGYRGPITLRNALALSLNTVAVKLNMEVGPKSVVQTAQRLGITSPLQADPSLALGTSEVTPLELVGAYASFANGGFRVAPYAITEVKTADGRVVFDRSASGDPDRVIEPGVDAMMNAMMHNVFVIGTAKAAQVPGWSMAGKTGTSNDYKDAWFVGFTGNLVAGVWLGNDDSTPTKGVSGGNLPTDVWHSFMKVALRDQKPMGLPGVAGAGQASAAEGGRARAHRPRRHKNFFERLFGL